MKKLSLFKLNPDTVFLVEEVESTALFPTDTGRFCTSQISPGLTHEVHGEPTTKGPQPPVPSSTPYGVYTTPVCIPTHQPHTASTYKPHPPHVPKKSVWKAVSLVSLSSVDTTKASTSKPQRMDYTVVTQVFLCLEPDQCNVRSVGDLVAWQVGFPVILEIFDKVSVIEKKVSTSSEVAKALQCSICQGVASPPVVSSCCQQVVACAGCNRTWRMGSERCPLCNTSTPQTFQLRGFDEIVGRLNPTDRDVAEDQHVAQVQGDGDSGDEFQDLPTFRVSPSQ